MLRTYLNPEVFPLSSWCHTDDAVIKSTDLGILIKLHRPLGRMQQMFIGSLILLTTDENKHFCYDKIIKIIFITKTVSTHLWYRTVMCDNVFFKTNHTDLSDYILGTTEVFPTAQTFRLFKMSASMVWASLKLHRARLPIFKVFGLYCTVSVSLQF